MLFLPSVGIRTTTTAWTRERECPVRPLQAATYALAVLCTGCAGHSPRSYRGIAALHLYYTLSGQQTLNVQLQCAHNIYSLRFLLALAKTGVGKYSTLQAPVSWTFIHPRYYVLSRDTPLANAFQQGQYLITYSPKTLAIKSTRLCLLPRLSRSGAGCAIPGSSVENYSAPGLTNFTSLASGLLTV